MGGPGGEVGGPGGAEMRFGMLRYAGWVSVVMWLVGGVVGLFEVRQLFADSRPNVFFVLADDQRFDTIAALGNPEIRTPNIDALVRRGFAFNNAYCQGGNSPAVCVPSRVQLLSGLSSFKTPRANLKEYNGPTLGRTFREAGYHTVCISKPGNSFPAAHQHFEKVVHIPHVGAETNQRCADAAIDAIEDYQKDEASNETPLFMYWAPSMPHDPRTAEQNFHSMYPADSVSLPLNYMQEQPVDFGVLSIRDEMLAAYPRQENEMKQHLAEYYACISSLDFHLGRVLRKMEDSRMLNNTIIVFTSDQGLAVGGRHGLMGKQNLYEHFKSPMILAGPGIPIGRSDALAYLFDLYPTLCDLAGLAPPDSIHGKSLVPVIQGQSSRVRDALFAVYMDSQRMCRDEQWKLIWYPKIGRMQLFDLKNDPHELENLAESKNHQAKLIELIQRMAHEQSQFGDNLAPTATSEAILK